MSAEQVLGALHAAFAEYAAARWEVSDWNRFGRETGTADLLNKHPRLYRSLGFGDEDYPDVVWRFTPSVLEEAAASQQPAEQMQLVAEFMPDLPSWVAESEASRRTKKRFEQFLDRHLESLPGEWADDATRGRPAFERGALKTQSAARAIQPFADSAESRIWPEPAPVDVLASWGTTVPLPQANESVQIAAESAPTSSSGATVVSPTLLEPSIFLVHGRSIAAVHEVQVFVQQVTGVLAESLADSPGRGDTIIEKFERRANNATFAIVLLTPDDVGRAVTEDENTLNPRARQNVVLELGYFIAKLGRDRVAVLNAGVERPSDIDGVSYIAYPGSNWKWALSSELEEAGFKRPSGRR